MPLQILPDRFSEAKHKELDKAVNEAMEGLYGPRVPIFLLTCIVAASNGELDPKFNSPMVTETLINAYEDLRAMLSSAWERKSYCDIRNLGACSLHCVHCQLIIVHRSHSRSTGISTEIIAIGCQRLALGAYITL